MKVLLLYSLYFKLPEDFDGGLSDALRLLADYHDKVKGAEIQLIGLETGIDATKIDHVVMWNLFLKMLDSGKRLVAGSASLSELKDGKMVELKDSLTK